MFTQVPNGAVGANLVAKQIRVAADHLKHRRQIRVGALTAAVQSMYQVSKQPGAPLTAPAHHDAVGAGSSQHVNGVVTNPNIPITQHGHTNRLLKSANVIPLGATRIVLLGGARM